MAPPKTTCTVGAMSQENESSFLFLFLRDRGPGSVRVEAFHLIEFIQGLRPKGTLHYKIHFAERRRRALPFQDFEEIAVVRLRAAGVALFDGSSNVLAHRTAPGAIGVLPSQATLLARSADDALGILVSIDRSIF